MMPDAWSNSLPLSLSGSGIWNNGVRKKRYSGTMMTCCGSRLPAVKIISARMLKRQLKWVTAKATIDATSSAMITDGIVMTRVFR